MSVHGQKLTETLALALQYPGGVPRTVVLDCGRDALINVLHGWQSAHQRLGADVSASWGEDDALLVAYRIGDTEARFRVRYVEPLPTLFTSEHDKARGRFIGTFYGCDCWTYAEQGVSVVVRWGNEPGDYDSFPAPAIVSSLERCSIPGGIGKPRRILNCRAERTDNPRLRAAIFALAYLVAKFA